MVSVTEGDNEASVIVLDESSCVSEVKKLRQRWELASVLNFINVFQSIIGNAVKLTAEEIELGLVESNGSNAQLHVALLKGIPPVSKKLDGSSEWVTLLCKKLAEWWPWVAEGDVPLSACKGEEVSRYGTLNPTTRLQILKALCEIRADQVDAVSYVNDTLKQGGQVFCFRKEKIGDGSNGTSYWYDGSATQGYRLYREVYEVDLKAETKGNTYLALPTLCFHWETIATNLEEFRTVSNELSSSKYAVEAATGKNIGTDVIPILEKLQKKKERALKRQQWQAMAISRRMNVGITRSGRNRKPICYTSDEFDRTIREAVRIIETDKKKRKRKLEHENSPTNDGSDIDKRSADKGNSIDSESESEKLQASKGLHDNSDDDDDEYDGKCDEEREIGIDLVGSDQEKDVAFYTMNHKARIVEQKPRGSRWSKRLAGESAHPCAENFNVSMKNRSRQRPTRNSALQSLVIPDSDDEISAEQV